MFTPIEFLAVALASGAIIELWHKGSIFATRRAEAQALQDITPHDSLKGLFLEWVNCPFCKSYHVPFYLLLLLLAAKWVGGATGGLFVVAIYGLAATRLGNIIEGFLPQQSKYVP